MLMSPDELKALQSPLKKRYQQHPEAAVVTLRAEGEVGAGIACNVETGRALVEAGLHPATGGDGSQRRSGAMLLEALVAGGGGTLCAVGAACGVGRPHG